MIELARRPPGSAADRLKRALGAGLLAALCGCGATATVLRPDAQLVVDCPVADARVYVDEVLAGRAADLRGRAVQVRAGARRVEVRADGYFTSYREVAVPHGGRATVAVELRRVPDNEPAE
jgi:hypothetical protein